MAENLFEEQAGKLKQALPFANIQHIGGTAIPGMLTKGDLDINVRVAREDFAATVDVLRSLYKINQPHNWSVDFASFEDDENLVLPLGVQVTVVGSSSDDFVLLRDALLLNRHLVTSVNDMKLMYQGAKMDDYRNAKTDLYSAIKSSAGVEPRTGSDV